MASILRRNQPFEDLPEEMLSEILSYLSYLTSKEKLNVSLVNKRWFKNINCQIEDVQIRNPTNTENIGDLKNFIKRFVNIRSLSLASKINNYSELLPLKSLIEKEEGKPPKIVKSSWYPLSGSSFLPKPM